VSGRHAVAEPIDPARAAALRPRNGKRQGAAGGFMTAASATRIFPFLVWPRPSAKTLRADLLAGLAVSLLVIPQSLAYAELAGVPAHYGLYAAFIPSIVGVLFGSSAILSTGPVALTSVLVASSVGQLSPPGSESFIANVMLLALLSGLFQIALGLARAGVLLNLLSHPVLCGFINAAAVVISLSQLPALTGISVPASGSLLLGTVDLLRNLAGAHVATLALGVLALALLVGFKRYAPRVPGVLVTVAMLTVLSYYASYEAGGGRVVGAIPAGLPGLSLPAVSWHATLALLPAAFVIALVSFMEAMSSCTVIAAKTRARWDENQELVGQGLAKVAAAFSHSMPVSGSFSRSALNLASHAATGYSSLFAAGFVLLALALFTPLLHHLPRPALAAMILVAVFNLIHLRDMRTAWRASRDDGIAAWLTFVATLAFAPNIQNGILAGIAFSLGAFIYRRMLPQFSVMGLGDDGALRELHAPDTASGSERIGVLRFDAALFFANASFFEGAVLRLERERPDLKYVVVLAQGINLLDATAVEMLRRLVLHLRECDITLVVSQAKRQFLDVAERTGLCDAIGRQNFFAADDAAFHALRERLSTVAPGNDDALLRPNPRTDEKAPAP
jgi:SulP family sulfate permease